MRKVKVKICGLKRAQDIECVNRLLPDYIGFVFAKTKREVTEQQAAQLKAMLNPQIKAVGVFVNAEIDKILRLAKSRTIDIIQLHGDEDAAYCERLRLQTELPIIKAVRVKDTGSFENLQAYPCDYLLFDTYT
ncbi:MAG: phosphoribosylanthranilate isomerase, partial [Phascolarctobacterium sp.]